MNFLAPLAFWFALALPVVVVFYILKRKRTAHLVSSTILWQRFLAESQANSPFQKLRNSWLMILQLLLLALVVFAISRPYYSGTEQTSGLKVLILDASASMQSTDAEPSRFEKARAEALSWVEGKKDAEQMIVLKAAGKTEVVQSETSNQAALRRALKSIQVTDGSTRMEEALKLAESLIEDRGDAEIHLFSDGAFPDLSGFENKSLPLVYHRVGERANNTGLVSLDVRANSENPEQRAVFASVMNFTTNRIRTQLELRFDDQMLEMRPLDLAPTNTTPMVFLVEQPHDGIFSVRVNHEDDLSVDNEASMVSVLPKTVKILLVTEGNQFLLRALRAAENAEVSVASNLTADAPEYDLVVLDNVIPSVWPKQNVLAIHAAPPEWFDAVDTLETPLIVKWENNHPLMRYVDFDGVLLAESLKVQTPTWAQSVVDSTRNPLILAGDRGRQRIVWIGFDTLRSNWPKRVAFPIFIANAVDWLDPNSARAHQLTVRAGEPIRYIPPTLMTNATVTLPDGSSEKISMNPESNELVFGRTDTKGTYRLTSGTNEVFFAVNAIDSNESNIAPKSEITLGQYTKTTEARSLKASIEFWRWIALAGLIVLLFEWWYYHRRTA